MRQEIEGLTRREILEMEQRDIERDEYYDNLRTIKTRIKLIEDNDLLDLLYSEIKKRLKIK